MIDFQDNPPINVMGPEMVKQFQEVINPYFGTVAIPSSNRLVAALLA